MKLTGREAAGYFKRPDPKRTGILIYGADAMRVALKRQELIAALIGPQGEEEMRLSRIAASELRKDPAMLSDALKAQSFFPGPRVAFVEDATDTLAKTVTNALQDWQDGDAQIVITAGALKASSSIRKLFESHKNAYAAGLYDDPPTRAEIEADLSSGGLKNIDPDAMTDLEGLSRVLGPGDFRQTIEKLSLYKLNDATPVSSADVAACAPTSTEVGLDDILNVVAEGQSAQIGPILAKLGAQGVQPVGLCIGAMRHFRTLHSAAADPKGPAAGMGRMRPPVFGPRRDRMIRQAQSWGSGNLEKAIRLLVDTDLQLRSTAKSPDMALMERALIRLSMMSQRRS